MKDVVDIFEDLESGFIPLYYVVPEIKIDVRLPSYDKPEAGPVITLTSEEYLAKVKGRRVR